MNGVGARSASVDALRGLTVAAMLLVNTPGDWGHVYAPLLHADWHGCTPTDLVFPFFLFVVGVSIALGLVPRVAQGADARVLHRAIASRGLRIIALGLLLNLAAWWAYDQPHYRPWGVLQRIGLCFIIAAPLAMHLRPSLQWALVAALLLGWWALLAPGGYAEFHNLADRTDTALFAPYLYRFDATTGLGRDPEGLLTTLPSVATVLLGVRAGEWLRRGRLRALWWAGAAMLVLGAAWSPLMPLNKALWTSSYVLWSGGWAALALAAMHVLIDRRGWPALGRSFGVNAITAYAGSALLPCALVLLGAWTPLYQHGFAGWMTPRFGPYVPSLTFSLAFVALWWGIARWMDRRGWHLKI
ncbi:acyltransferase family protein [Luteimonas sp. SDU101]|uniref:acyltransferase family protein n=1 Tax=Luteimonas sp. SDU101 TaxID=3422593 RepID=UPI003EBAEF69